MQYSELDDQIGQQNEEDLTVEFNMLVKWKEKLTPEQIEIMKTAKYRNKLFNSSQIFIAKSQTVFMQQLTKAERDEKLWAQRDQIIMYDLSKYYKRNTRK